MRNAIDFVVDFASATYEDMMYQLPERQKKVLRALALEGRCEGILSGEFVKRYGLQSVSSVNSAVKGLQERNLLVVERGTYSVYDKFLGFWLKKTAQV